MYLISGEGYKNAGLDLLIIKKLVKFSQKGQIQNDLGVQNISDLVLIEIYVIYKTKSLTKERIKRYKMTKKFEDEDELNAKNNKEVYAKNNVMTIVMKRCKGERKEAT